MGSYASYAVRDSGGNIIGYQSAYTGQITYEGGGSPPANAHTVDTPQPAMSGNTAAEIAQLVGKTGGVVDPSVARIAAAQTATPSAAQEYDYDTNVHPALPPTMYRATETRPGYYASTELGDTATQTRAKELMNQPNKPFGSYDDAVRYTLEEQRQAATDSRAKSFYENELTKSIQEPIEAASQYHYMAKETGRAISANPYEYQADLAVELLKGAPVRSSEVFSPVSGEMSKYLPGGAMGVQQHQWNTALGKNENVNFMPGLAALQAAEGIEGPYGALYGGTGAKSITPESVANVMAAYPKQSVVTTIPTQQDTLGGAYNIPGSLKVFGRGETNVPTSEYVVTTMPTQVKSSQPTKYFSGGEYADLPLPFVSTVKNETLGGAYVVPGSLKVYEKGGLTGFDKNVNIGDTNIPSTFSDVSNIFKTTPILSNIYDIGSKVPSGEVPVLSSVYKLGTETKLPVASDVLSGISQGGAATESYYDYQKVASTNTEKINAIMPDYENSLNTYNKNMNLYNMNANKMQEGYDNLLTQQKDIESKSEIYNKNLESYKSNPTQDGYNSLISQQKNLQTSIDTYSKNVDVFNKQSAIPTQKEYENLTSQKTDLDTQYGKISTLQGQIDTAESHYIKSASPLTGNVDQTKLLTYGVGSAIGDVGKWYSTNVQTPIETAVSGWGVPGDVISGLSSTPEMIAQLGQSALVGGETILRNPSTFAGLATAGLAMQVGGMYQSATTNPAKFAGSLIGQYLLFKGGEKLYEAQPYRVGLQRAEIISSKGAEAPTGKYTSFGVSKLFGADKQIEQLTSSLVGVGGKTTSPTDVIIGSNLLKGSAKDISFTTKMNTFADASQAAQRYTTLAKGGVSDFYHVTPENAFVNQLLTTGEVVVGKGGKEGALFFGDPGTILKQYAGETGTKVALRLRTTPEVTPEFASAVGKIKSSGAYGRNFADIAATLPPGKLYPGLRAAAGKPWKGLGLEEEYVVAPETKLYLKNVENVVSPSGEKWAILDVSTSPQLLPNLKYGAVKAVSTLKNVRPYIGIPKPTAEMFKFKTEGSTYAMESPLEVAIGKKYIAPEESPKLDLMYKTHEITSGSGAKYDQASTAIGEVVKARKFPNSAEVTEAILQTSLDYGAKLYGSAGQKAVGIERGVTTLLRNPNDLDVMIPSEAGQPGKLSLVEGIKSKLTTSKTSSLQSMGDSYAQDVTSAINKAAGKKVVYVKDGTVEMSDGSGKLFDIHNENPTVNELLKQETSPFRSSSGYFGLGMKPQKYVSTTEGLEVMPYAEQIGRKASGAMEITPEPRTVTGKGYEGGPEVFSVTGKIAPRFEGRMKDIGDYYIGEKGNIELMSKSSNPLTRAKAAKADVYLEQWLDLWGKDASTKVRQNYVGGKFNIDLSVPSSTGVKSVRIPVMSGASIIGSLSTTAIPKYSPLMGVGSLKPSDSKLKSVIATSEMLSAPSKEMSLSKDMSGYISPIEKSISKSVSKESSEIPKGFSSSLGSLKSVASIPSVSEISLPSVSKIVSPIVPSISIFSPPSPPKEGSPSMPNIPSTPSSTKISPPSIPSIPTSLPPSTPKPPSPGSPIPILPTGGNLYGSGGIRDKKKRYKPHVQVFDYNFDPWKAARITAKALAVGSNVTRGPKSSLPTFSLQTPKPTIKVAPRVVKAPAQKILTPSFKMPSINVGSTTGLKSISLASSLPQKKKRK